jgi:hypothetical protein
MVSYKTIVNAPAGTLKEWIISARDTYIEDHGPDDDPAGDGECGHEAGPEAETAEGDKNRVAGGKRDAGLFRQSSADSDGDKEAGRPHKGDFEREQQGLTKNRCGLHRFAHAATTRPLVNFTFPHRDDTI